MFASSLLLRIGLVALAIVLLWALFANDSGAAGAETRYRVKPGDTLWGIAERHFAGDPREGVWEIERQNRLRSSAITPGQILVLP